VGVTRISVAREVAATDHIEWYGVVAVGILGDKEREQDA
jgi:hypothetical protein